MTYSALVNTLVSYERQFGTATYSAQGQGARSRITTPSRSTISFPAIPRRVGAAAYIVAPMTALISNDYEKVDIEGLELTFKSTEEPRTATLERVWIDDPRPRAGRTVPLKVLLRTYRGEDLLRTMPIAIPAQRQRQPVDRWCPTASG